MEKEILKVPATISKITTMSDNGLRLQVDTQEISPKDSGEVMELRNKLGVFIFAEANIEEDDLKDLPKVVLEEKEKTSSERLRSVLFIYWKQKKLKEDFDPFYKRQMEKFIDIIKEKLD